MKIVIDLKRLYIYKDNDTLRITFKIYKRDIEFTIEKQLIGLSALFR